MRRYALRDDQWDRIKEILPGREGHVGGTAADNRLFVEAILFRFRAGIPWRDLPERFGDWKIVYQRFNRWAKSGVFERVFKLLASDHDNEYMMIDATIVRAHPPQLETGPSYCHDLCQRGLAARCDVPERGRPRGPCGSTFKSCKRPCVSQRVASLAARSLEANCFTRRQGRRLGFPPHRQCQAAR